ncbi:hypothetical protein CSA08_03320 [Candidatus Gracilibacteria bacterium]|nr:MAG: hypothetical protein CSA08_03320 [Candidatus Gracilibacteria bacterium]
MPKNKESTAKLKKFSGNITFKGKIDTSILKYEFLETYMEDGTINVFTFGKTELETSKDLIDDFSQLGEIIDSDITIEGEGKIVLLNNKVEGNIYELVSFEGVEVCFEEIIERFAESIEVVSIRESSNSKKFANKIIKTDFIY